jgi:hypothetical protein
MLASVGKDIKVDPKEIKQELRLQKSTPSEYLLEGVLLYLHRPQHFVLRECKRCGSPYRTNYTYVAYCSDLCRAKALQELGVPYDMHANNWGQYEPPIVLTGNVLKALPLLEKPLRIKQTLPSETSVDVVNSVTNPKLEEDHTQEDPLQQHIEEAPLQPVDSSEDWIFDF